ncbi:hypothetical protein OF83DRAFT_621982 [Amylostereum chailletii]|nr:hypothetical protein OF83DRAFT_621982 [Amylostereum chailletii]
MPSIRSVSESDSSSHTPPEVLSHETRRQMGRSRRITRSSIDIHSKDITSILLHEEREANGLRQALISVTQQLKQESQRADDNERQAREAILRFKAINDARVAAQQDAARANEELRLYKLQLENAQREIFKAQEILDSMEDQRYQAEASAARARNTARKMKEERLVDLAREEGRRQGMREALAMRGGLAPYEQARRPPAQTPDMYRDVSLERHDFEDAREALDAMDDTMLDYQPEPPGTRTPVAPSPPPPANSIPPSPERSQPIPVNNVSSPLQHFENIVPLEGFIPRADADGAVRLPPPHEMQNPVPSPDPKQSNLPPETPPLMVLDPATRRTNDTYAESVASRHSRQSRPSHQHQRRAGSPESQGSTTISQFELVSEPYGPTSRPSSSRPSRMNRRSLSVIPESISGGTTPAHRADSLAGDRPGSRGPEEVSKLSTPASVNAPIPQNARPDLAAMEHQVYRRPSYASSTSDSSASRSAPRTPRSDTRSSNKRASSASVPDITVQPPSRPASQTPQATPATMARDFLSADDAANRPEPPPSTTPPDPPSNTLPPMTPGGTTIVLKPGQQLPFGFIPIGDPMPSPSQNPSNVPYYSPSPAVPATPGSEARYRAPSDVSMPPDRGVPKTPSSSSRGSGRGEPTGQMPRSGSTNRSSVVVPSPSLLRRAEESLSTTSTSNSDSDDDAVSSSLASSRNTLSTPPPQSRPRKKAAARPAYATAPVDAGFQYPSTPLARTVSPVGAAASVPLPPSTIAASPRTTTSFVSNTPTTTATAGMTPAARNTPLRGRKKGKR